MESDKLTETLLKIEVYWSLNYRVQHIKSSQDSFTNRVMLKQKHTQLLGQHQNISSIGYNTANTVLY